MKKIVILFLTLVLCFSFFACGKQVESIVLDKTEISIRVEESYDLSFEIIPEDIENPKITWTSSDSTIAIVDETGKITGVAEGTAEITAKSGKTTATCSVKVGKKVVTETDYIKIEGIYLDNNYKDKEKESTNLLYVFYTAKTPDKQLKVDSKSLQLTFESGNTYEAEHYSNYCDYMKNYYYSSYLEEVNIGDSVKFVETIKIPQGELKNGESFTFSKSQIPQTENLVYLLEDIVECDGAEAIAKKADPEGYKIEINNQKVADSETTSKVRSMINDYEWSFYVNSTSYKVTFYAPNNFELYTIYNTVDGTYTVKNGYVTLNYPATGHKVDIPYYFEDGEIKLEIADAFDVSENWKEDENDL